MLKRLKRFNEGVFRIQPGITLNHPADPKHGKERDTRERHHPELQIAQLFRIESTAGQFGGDIKHPGHGVVGERTEQGHMRMPHHPVGFADDDIHRADRLKRSLKAGQDVVHRAHHQQLGNRTLHTGCPRRGGKRSEKVGDYRHNRNDQAEREDDRHRLEPV